MTIWACAAGHPRLNWWNFHFQQILGLDKGDDDSLPDLRLYLAISEHKGYRKLQINCRGAVGSFDGMSQRGRNETPRAQNI